MTPRKTLHLRPIYLGYWTVAAVFAGMLLAPTESYEPKSHHDGAAHVHETQEVDTETPPEVTLAVTKDSLSGWNVTVATRHFVFAPEMVNQANVPHHGHAHLYVNGRKLARLYSSAFHIGNLPEGRNIVSVSLNANDHADLVLNGQPIKAEVVVMNPADANTANPSDEPQAKATQSIQTKG